MVMTNKDQLEEEQEDETGEIRIYQVFRMLC
jgi:hypothetical protein